MRSFEGSVSCDAFRGECVRSGEFARWLATRDFTLRYVIEPVHEPPPSDALFVVAVADCAEPDRLEVALRRRTGWITEVESTPTANEALELVGLSRVDCLVIPPSLETDSLDTFLEAARELGSSMPAIIYGDEEDTQIRPSVISAGVDDFVSTNGIDDGYESLASSVASHVNGRDTTSRIDRFHEALIENSADVLSILGCDGTIEYVSPAVESVLGYDSRELLGELAIEYVHPDDVEDVRYEFFGDPRSWIGEQRKGTYRFRDASGKWRVVESLGYSLVHDPVVEGVVINSRDVTERERRKEELELYETIVETVPVSLFVVDEEARIDLVNQETVDAVDVPENDLLGMRIVDLIEEGYLEYELIEQYVEGVREMLSSESDVDRLIEDVPFYPSDGDEPRYLNVHWGLRPFEDGEFSGTVVAFQDITERNTYERELERKNERLSRFASFVSHDLRNPLNVAQGYVTQAIDTGDHDALEEVQVSLDRMEELIQELLTLASEGHIVDQVIAVDLEMSARQAWRTVETKSARLEVIDDFRVLADESLLRQLFENLFRNAVEHGSTSPPSHTREDAVEHGGEDVTVRVGGLDEDEPGFFVEDDGLGIPESERESIFELGYTTNENGTGFGLGIVSETAEGHGWELTVTDGTDGGARFEFSSVEIDEA